MTSPTSRDLVNPPRPILMYIAVVILQRRPFFQRSHLPHHQSNRLSQSRHLLVPVRKPNPPRREIFQWHWRNSSHIQPKLRRSRKFSHNRRTRWMNQLESVVPLHSNITRTLKPLISRTIVNQLVRATTVRVGLSRTVVMTSLPCLPQVFYVAGSLVIKLADSLSAPWKQWKDLSFLTPSS